MVASCANKPFVNSGRDIVKQDLLYFTRKIDLLTDWIVENVSAKSFVSIMEYIKCLFPSTGSMLSGVLSFLQ